jgi:homoserine acetyltransferase
MVSVSNIFLIRFYFLYNRAHSSEGPEPAYQKIVSGYETYKHENEPFRLKYNNKSLNQFDLAYETWGKLNAKKNNAVLIFTGLSASSHAKSHDVCYY